MTRRLLPLAVAALALGAGLGIGTRLSEALRPSAPAIAAPPAPAAYPPTDFAAIARQATPAVVNISALQVFRSERSPFFSDPF